MNDQDLQYFKEKLEAEHAQLLAELSKRGNVVDGDDFVAKLPAMQSDNEDPLDAADTVEEMENNIATVSALELKFNQVKAALERIEKGTYGKSLVSGEMIVRERLEANPTATTTIAEMNMEA